MRAPKGEVTITSKILNKLNTSIPIKDKKNLIPTFVDATFEKGQQILKGASQKLKVKAIHNERIRTLFIRLEGSLDLSAAKQLIKRLQFSLKKEKRKIIIDFTGIQYLSPKAANLLVTKNLKRLFKKKKQIEMRNFSQIASGAFTNIANLISDDKTTEGEAHPPQEIDPQTFHDHL